MILYHYPMPESIKFETTFTFSDSVKEEIRERAKLGEEGFSVEISLERGKMTAWCFQGPSARERASAAWEAVSGAKEFVSDIKEITPNLFAFTA